MVIVVKGGKLLSVLGWYNVSDVRMLEVDRALVFYMFLEHPYCEQMIALLPHIVSTMTVFAERVAVLNYIVEDIL